MAASAVVRPRPRLEEENDNESITAEQEGNNGTGREASFRTASHGARLPPVPAQADGVRGAIEFRPVKPCHRSPPLPEYAKGKGYFPWPGWNANDEWEKREREGEVLPLAHRMRA